MTVFLKPLALAIALSATAALPAHAQVKTGPTTYAQTLENLDRHPVSAAEARRTLDRIEKAALVVCGASRDSLRVVRRAIRKSACFRDSVDRAVDEVGNPLLTRVRRSGK